MNTIVHIRNRTKRVVVEGKTLYEAYYGKKPVITHLRVFVFDAYVRVHKDTRTKLDSHSRKCIFIGYNKQSKAYRVYDPVKRQVLINRDVVFEEIDTQATEEV